MSLTYADWISSTDPYELGIPVASGLTRDTSNRYVEFTLASGGLYISESNPELTEIWYANTDGSGGRRELDFNGEGVFYYWSATAGYSRQYNTLVNTYGDSPTDGGNFNSYLSPVGAGLDTGRVRVFWEQDTSVYGEDYLDYTLEVSTPYQWANKDAAQLLFALTRYYSGDGTGSTAARDYLSYSGLQAYSDFIEDNYFYRTAMDVWAEQGRTLQDTVASILKQSGAMALFSVVESGVAPLNFQLTLKHANHVDTWSETLDLTTYEDQMIIGSPTLRYANNYIQNSFNMTWGSHSTQNRQQDESGDNYSSCQADKGGVLPNNANKFSLSNETSIEKHGHRTVSIDLPNIMDDHAAGARLCAVKDRWNDTLRELRFSMGPLHLDFGVGDIIKVTSADYGLSETEFLVTKKRHNWDTLSADIEALEYTVTEMLLSPDDEVLSDRLGVWFEPENIQEAAGFCIGWNDSSGNGLNGTIGTAAANVVSDAINGYDAMDCGAYGTDNGIAYVNWQNEVRGNGFTAFCVLKPDVEPAAHSGVHFYSGNNGLSSNYIAQGISGLHYHAQSDPNMLSSEEFTNEWQIVTWTIRINPYPDTYDDYYTLSAAAKDGELLTLDNTQANDEFVWDDSLQGALGYGGGAGLGFGGYIAEYIAFSDSLRPHETQGVINYLKNKYNI